MTNYFYSAKRNAFYPSVLKVDYEASPESWPQDAIAITDEDYQALLDGQAQGKAISPDSSGKPVLTDPAIDWQAKAESQCQSLLSAANATISFWQTKLLAGKQLSEEQKTKLDDWLEYMDELEDMNFASIDSEEKYHALSWPIKP